MYYLSSADGSDITRNSKEPTDVLIASEPSEADSPARQRLCPGAECVADDGRAEIDALYEELGGEGGV